MTTSRLPFGRTQGSSFFRKKLKNVVVTFPWFDSFHRNKQVSDYDINFERAAVLFNIGSMYSNGAIREDRSDFDGLKRAFAGFQNAAGVFTLLATTTDLCFNHSVCFPLLFCLCFSLPYFSLFPFLLLIIPCFFLLHSTHTHTQYDMSAYSYRMISHMMLGQAQACFFEQAIKKDMRPSIIAKLAMGAANFFHHAYQALCCEPINSWLAKSSYKWKNHIVYQNRCFEASAHLWMSRHYGSEDKYGLEIAELKIAHSICMEAAKFEAKLMEGLQHGRLRLLDLIQTKLKTAVYDNDTIYHDVIPSFDKMDKIEPKFVAKATPYEVPTHPQDAANPFSSLIPVKVHEDSNLYTQQLNSILAQIQQECKEAHDLAKMHLASLNLPAALEATEVTDNRIPPKLMERHREAREKGGVNVCIIYLFF